MLNISQEKVLRDVLVQNTSLSWHEDQMRKILFRIKEIEDNNDLNNVEIVREYKELRGKLTYLLGKFFIETKIRKKLKEELNKSSLVV